MVTEKNIKCIVSGSNDTSELQKAFSEAIKSLPNTSGKINGIGYFPLQVGKVTVEFMTDHDQVVIDPLPYRNAENDYPGTKNFYENEYCKCVASVCINGICLNCNKKSNTVLAATYIDNTHYCQCERPMILNGRCVICRELQRPLSSFPPQHINKS